MTRFKAFKILLDKEDVLDETNSIVFLSPTHKNFHIWQRALQGDRAIVVSTKPSVRIILATIKNKGLSTNANPFAVAKKSLIIYLSTEGVIANTTVNFSQLSVLSSEDNISSEQYETLRSIATQPKLLNFSLKRSIEDVTPFTHGSNIISFAKDELDLAALATFSEAHPFGVAAGLQIVLRDKNNKIVAGAVVRRGEDSMVTHSSELKAFGENYSLLRFSSIHVARLLSERAPNSGQKYFYKLLKFIIFVAPYLVENKITYVSGISYDYIPAAVSVGARVEFPQSYFGSMFYWKPIPDRAEIRPDKNAIKSDYRRLLEPRRKHSGWLLLAAERLLSVVHSRGIWALKAGSRNNGLWRSLKSGDDLFFCTGRRHVVIKAKMLEQFRLTEPGYYDYPLGIRLEHIQQLDSSINLDRELEKGFLGESRGGIIPLSVEEHLRLLDLCDERTGERKMWVTPNPYLFKRTNITGKKGHVFVVQSWGMKDSILPMIRDICKEAGYTATHAEDLSGQIVFEDVWLLLNEAEVVLIDFTEKRPNVYLEFGMALVLGRPIVAITQSLDDLPSDTQNIKCIVYSKDNAYKMLKESLVSKIETVIKDTNDLHRTP